jgi:hypothetical protein
MLGRGDPGRRGEVLAGGAGDGPARSVWRHRSRPGRRGCAVVGRGPVSASRAYRGPWGASGFLNPSRGRRSSFEGRLRAAPPRFFREMRRAIRTRISPRKNDQLSPDDVARGSRATFDWLPFADRSLFAAWWQKDDHISNRYQTHMSGARTGSVNRGAHHSASGPWIQPLRGPGLAAGRPNTRSFAPGESLSSPEDPGAREAMNLSRALERKDRTPGATPPAVPRGSCKERQADPAGSSARPGLYPRVPISRGFSPRNPERTTTLCSG